MADALQFTLRVHNITQTHELANNICKHYFGDDAEYTFDTQASLAPEDAEQAIFTVLVWANGSEFTLPEAKEAAE